MFITACSLTAVCIIHFLLPLTTPWNPTYLFCLLLTSGTVTLLASLFLDTVSLIPFTRLEQQLIANVTHRLRNDTILCLERLFILLFSFLSFIAAAVFTQLENVYQNGLILGWIVALGLVLDCLRHYWARIVNLLNPSYATHALVHTTQKAIQNNHGPLIWSGIDQLMEIGVRSVENNQMTLSTQVLQAFPSIMQTLFTSAKSISHISHDQTVEKQMGMDQGSYGVFYAVQRLELMYDRALQKRMEPVCRQMMMTMGKIILYSAQYDLSLVAFPVHFLTKFGLQAIQHHFDEVSVLTTSTLLEIAKTILTTMEISYADLKQPFQAIINGLDALAKATFKKNKNTSIKVLVQPLIDLKQMFQTEKASAHRDTPLIVDEIDRVLGEFAMLEQVMQTIPPLSEMTSSENAADG
jgi:hypothetical protein